MTTLWFKVSADGLLVETSSVEPSEDGGESNMPATGASFTANSFATALLMALLGLVLIGVSWRLRTRN